MGSNAVETKWSRRWAESKIFEPEPDPEKEKRYITAAFPYPNSPQHIGHGRTYTTADIYARYLRLKGFHVLFPMAFHVTGTPILAMARRIAAKDREVYEIFDKIYGIPPEKTASLDDPRELVAHFSEEIERGMKEMGYSIDWRRKFYSYDGKFNRFIQWQFRKLKEKGYLIKGDYPIAWCPSDNQAVSAHDTKGDVDPEIEEVTAIKFRTQGGLFFVIATYRPETVYGVTNIWINPKIRYVRAKHHGETLILSGEAAGLLDLQLKGLEVLGEISSDELLGMTAVNPAEGASIKEVPVFPASFVREDVGTGVVMSVPAHAPLDYLALRDLGKGGIPMPQVLSVGGRIGNPAKETVEKLKVKSQDDPNAEEATKELYLRENSGGVMLAGKYKGKEVKSARVSIADDLGATGSAYIARILANGPVFCRCGSKVKVNILQDQWFIDYGKPEWKILAKECLAGLKTIPEKTRAEYLYTIDWLQRRPCARSSGLGTPFPFDETKVIEALSDSTVYMAFYTISHLLEGITASEMDDAFFDAIFLGSGPKTQNPKLKTLRQSFLYWYPLDSRHSAGDLIRNHLTLFIFNHVGIFGDKKLWPKQIVTNGFVLMDGTKMSKSMGNILPIRKAITEYGADVVRFSVVAGAELSSDTDFNRGVAEGVRSRLDFIASLVRSSAGLKLPPPGRIESWLLSRMHRRIGIADKMYQELAMRELSLLLFYDVFADLQWYMKRSSRPNLREFFPLWIPLISPFMPHYAEEFWELIHQRGFVTNASFPGADPARIDDALEFGEELVRKVHGDIEKISELIGRKPAKVTLYVAGEWKRKLYGLAKANPSFEALMKAASAEKMPMKEVQGVAKQVMKSIHALPLVLPQKEELAALKDAESFLAKEYSCNVEVLPEEEAKHEKAKSALPAKPAIVLE
jgi:leucyl-tRNA synthetase